MKEILFIEPVFKEMIWGGCRLRDEFGYDIQSDCTGECWAVSAHKNGDSKILGGRFDGKSLSWLWNNNRELFGDLPGEKFPLLVKIIDAKEDLSIQVHPDDIYANLHENGSSGKTECWYILDCDTDAEIIIGHNAKTKEELFDMIDNGKWDDFIRKVPIKKGGFFQIDPGTVHAIKGGTLILETQQNSDITYRLYDYDRVYNGKKRELHIEKGKEVITVPYKEEEVAVAENLSLPGKTLISCLYYTVIKLDIMDEAVIEVDKDFIIVSVIEGFGTIDDYAVKKGSNFILPSYYQRAVFKGKMSLIMSISVHSILLTCQL